MSVIQQLLTDHIDIWSVADTGKKSGRGRSAGNAASVYGIGKLRELILELAVRGKLVQQDVCDAPASALIKSIQTEKANLITEGKIKNDKSLPQIIDDEKPYALPNGWEWVRLSDITSVRGGSTPSMAKSEYWDGDIPWISPKDMHDGAIVDSELKITNKALKETNLEVVPVGSILIVGRSGILKRKLPAQITAVPCTVNQDIKAVTPIKPLSNKYMQLIFLGNEREILIRDVKQGTTVQSLVYESLFSRPFGLPPAAEQNRIVAKVDELMALCDQLEAQHNNAADAHEKLVSHLLGTLTQSQSADDFSTNWQRIVAHFDTLFTTEASIDALKQTLLQLAVMGKLVRQDPKDEPASALLKRIPAEKAKLISQGKIKKGQPLPLISEEERPFRLHDKWGWCRFDDLWESSFYGPRFGKEDYVNFGGIPTIRTTDMTSDGLIELDSPPEVLVPEEKIDMYQIKYGDLLVTRSGSIGTMALFLLDMVAIPSAYLIRIRFLSLLDPKYGLLYLMSPLGQHFLGLNSTSVGVPNVNATKMASFPFPLPPLLEQHRIVVKVDELMALCEQLKSRITDASQLQQKLAGVMVERAVA